MKVENIKTEELILQARELTDKADHKAALAVLQEIIELDSTHAEAYYLTAFNLHVFQKAYEKAVTAYQKAIEFGFDEFWVRYNLGSLFYAMNDFRTAQAELERAVTLNPRHAGAKQVLRKVQTSLSKQSENLNGNMVSARTLATIQHTVFINHGRIDDYEIAIPQNLKKYQPLNPLNFEEELYQGLKIAVEPGMVVFEAGSYCGVLTTIMAQMVGETGQVHVFEAALDSFERARNMVNYNRKSNVTLNNVFLAEKSDSDMAFYVIRSSDGWAVSSADPGIKTLYPEADEIVVHSLALDDYIRDTGIIPDVIKMDIEGAEFSAFQGAKNMLQKYTPDLILEVHGDRMPGISGNTAILMQTLAQVGYSFLDLETGRWMTSEEYTQAYPIYGHVYCSKKNISPHIIKRFGDLIANNQQERESYLEKRRQMRELVDRRCFQEALTSLSDLLNEHPGDAELLYLYAYCRHNLGNDLFSVLQDYQNALDHGFDEFWVRYNRGNLYYQMGNLQAAIQELQDAIRLNPAHEEAADLLKSIEASRNDNQ